MIEIKSPMAAQAIYSAALAVVDARNKAQSAAQHYEAIVREALGNEFKGVAIQDLQIDLRDYEKTRGAIRIERKPQKKGKR